MPHALRKVYCSIDFIKRQEENIKQKKIVKKGAGPEGSAPAEQNDQKDIPAKPNARTAASTMPTIRSTLPT